MGNIQNIIIFSLFLIPISLFSHTVEEGDQDVLHFHIDLTEEERHWLNDHSVIRVGGPLKFPPFHFYDEHNIPQGIAADYAALILESLGVEVKSVGGLPWPEVLKKSEDRTLDLIACLAENDDRRTYLDFTDPHLNFPLVIIKRVDSPFISGLEDLKSLTVAIVKGNAVKGWLVDDGVLLQEPLVVKTPTEALQAVSTGSADVYVGNLATFSFNVKEYGLVNLQVAAPTHYGNYTLSMGVRNDWPMLVSILNKGLASISPEDHARIRNRWLSVKYDYGLKPKDVILTVLLVLFVTLIILFLIMRWNWKLAREIEIRKKAESDLRTAFDDINTLTGLLPICAHCKNIRDDKGYWNQLEGYFEKHSDVTFSHSLCPDCVKELYGEIQISENGEEND